MAVRQAPTVAQGSSAPAHEHGDGYAFVRRGCVRFHVALSLCAPSDPAERTEPSNAIALISSMTRTGSGRGHGAGETRLLPQLLDESDCTCGICVPLKRNEQRSVERSKLEGSVSQRSLNDALGEAACSDFAVPLPFCPGIDS